MLPAFPDRIWTANLPENPNTRSAEFKLLAIAKKNLRALLTPWLLSQVVWGVES